MNIKLAGRASSTAVSTSCQRKQCSPCWHLLLSTLPALAAGVEHTAPVPTAVYAVLGSIGEWTETQQVLMVQTVQETVEDPSLQSIDEVFDIPALAQRQIPVVQAFLKTTEFPLLSYIDKVVDVLVVQVVMVPQVQVVQKTIEIPRVADRGEHR